MRKFATYYALWLLVGAIIALALGGAPHPAAAQTETPPVTSEIIEIEGENLKLDHTVTLGDISIVIVLLFLSVILSMHVITTMVTKYIH